MDISMLYHASAETQNLMDEIVAQAQRGDKEAFGVIFEQHHRFIYKFIYAMLGDHGLAEELTQETFLGAYKNLHSLRSEAALKTWLCSIAKNTVYKSFRSRRKEGKQSEEEVETLDLVDYKNPLPDEKIINQELNTRIGAALANLDEDKRVVFILKEIQQLSYNEIAEITGDAVPKLKTDLFRAKAKMRTMLQPYLEVKKNEL
jgi:RNA polymerase sigma-70 factor (ECF subfamily)